MKKISLVLCFVLTIPFIFCSCFYQEAESITLSNDDLIMTIGETSELTASISPETAKDKSVSWSSSNEDVATVSSSGKVKAIGSGNAIIVALTDNGVKGYCNVSVNDIEISEIQLLDSTVAVYVGKNIEITATVLPVDASDKELEWTSSNESVALVNSSGFVTGVEAGVANITCTANNGVSATCTVTVKNNISSSSKSSSSSSSKSSSSSSSSSENQESSNSSDSGSSDYILPYSATRKLTVSDISGFSSSEIQQAINEIYARHGREFKDEDVRAYFESKSWYSVNYNYSDSDLSDIENYNISFLSKYR